MKKSILFGLSPAILLLIITACQKEKIAPSASSKEVVTTKAQVNNLRVWHDNGAQPGVEGVDYGCWSTGGNCLPDVVVTPKLSGLLVAFSQSTSPGVFASDNYSDLSTVINTDLLDKVIGGKLTVSLRGEIGKSKVGYLAFTSFSGVGASANGTVAAVYPFKN